LSEPSPIPAHEPPAEDPPRRPRRRLLAPLPVTLLIALLTTCGFIGGVLVEKGSATSGASTSAGSLSARFAGLRSAGAGAGGVAGGGAAGAPGPGAAGAAGGGAGPSGANAASGPPGAGGGATVGTVAFRQGSTLYVTNAEGNTVKVKTSAASSVSKTSKSSVAAIHPGESVAITGQTASNGTVTAESIRVGATGLSSPFGGNGSSTGGAGGTGPPALFGAG